jgi:ribonucleoside-triphosphate reductase (thioredoxin)
MSLINVLDTEEILSELNIHNKYAKYIPNKQRRENWDEIIERDIILHLRKFIGLEKEIREAFQLVLDKKILPSMRSLQFAGKPIEVNPTRIYNCAFSAIDSYKAFGEAMFLLLGGCGFGFSVQKHHIEKLPLVRKPLKTKRFLVSDSIEGWADSVHHLVKAYFANGAKPIFDFRDIRPKGAKLVTAGGKAPGPAPLKICLAKIEDILENKKDGDQIKPIEVHDMICHIADAVLAGGIRRAATISLFSFDDKEMLQAKTGNWWESNPQRGRANNSISLVRSKIEETEFKDIWKQIEQSHAGEPGIFFTNDKDIGANPCCEISLKSCQFCNLVEVNVSNISSQEDLNERVTKAAFIATLQASYTDFHFLRPIWEKNSKDDALIGVSMTGISDGEVFQYDLKEAAECVKKENERVASLIGINKARRCTTVKPSGNSSVVLKTSSGIHSRFAPYYWRRMRIGKNESIYTYLTINAPELLEEDESNSSLAIVKVSVNSPEHSIYREENVISFLERIKAVHQNWIKPGHRKGANFNNVSATVSIKDSEWDSVGNWLWTNRDSYNGISVLPYDGGTYKQTPFEDCTKRDYEDFLNKIKDIKIDLDDVVEFEDNTDLKGEVACGGAGGCEIK